jgi:hypothetical protein
MNSDDLLHASARYLLTRREMFQKLINVDYNSALTILNKNQFNLNKPSLVGLKAELIFFKKYEKNFQLEIAADFGHKFDFIGSIETQFCRIDVTTNINFKNLRDYEPFQREEKIYKIAIMNYSGKLEELLDINFPFDERGIGRIFSVLILSPDTIDDYSNGELFQHKIVNVSSYEPAKNYEVVDTFSGVVDIGRIINIYDEAQPYVSGSLEKHIEEHCFACAKMVNSENSYYITAVGQLERIYIEGQFVNRTRIYWNHPVINNYLPTFIDVDLTQP